MIDFIKFLLAFILGPGTFIVLGILLEQIMIRTRLSFTWFIVPLIGCVYISLLVARYILTFGD